MISMFMYNVDSCLKASGAYLCTELDPENCDQKIVLAENNKETKTKGHTQQFGVSGHSNCNIQQMRQC